MAAVVVSVVVVGACIAVGVWRAVGGSPTQAATAIARRARDERAGTRTVAVESVLRRWARVRSAVTLAFLSTVLGVAVAAAVGLSLVLVVLVLRSSVG